MKALYLLRHAKAARKEGGQKDFDRPLTRKGTAAAAAVAAYMERESALPDLVLCSSSARTRETLVPFAERLQRPLLVDFRRDFYLAEASQLLATIKAAADARRAILVVGHNPGLEDLARILAGAGEPAARHALAGDFPPGALAVIRFAAARWRDIGRGRGELIAYVTPADLVEAS